MTEIEPNSMDEVKRIVQITDSHLFADEAAVLAGMNCQEGLVDVLELVRRKRQPVDSVLCTGDIAQDASVEAYRRFRNAIAGLDAPQYWIPGNHDVPWRIEEALGADSPCLRKTVTLGSWKVILLDSSVEGHVYGALADDELEFLARQLEESRGDERHVLIAVHHNPVPVEAEWLQNHCLKNSDELFTVTDSHPQIKCMLFGHIHQDFDRERKGVRMLASPSTSIQFHPENDFFTLDHKNPGYRWLELHEDGSFTTGVERVTGKTYDIDFATKGY